MFDSNYYFLKQLLIIILFGALIIGAILLPQKIRKKLDLLKYPLGFVLLLIICFAIYNKYGIDKYGINTEALIFQNAGFSKVRPGTRNVNYVYIVDNRPFIGSVTGTNLKIGDSYNIKYNKHYPSRINNVDKSLINSFRNKVLIFGIEFPDNNQKIEIFSKDTLLRRVNFRKEFVFLLEFKSEIIVKYYKEGKVYQQVFKYNNDNIANFTNINFNELTTKHEIKIDTRKNSEGIKLLQQVRSRSKY